MKSETLLFQQQYELYRFYNDRLRWVIIFIESRYGKFPVPILNEIRAVQDHIARCYDSNKVNDEQYIAEQMHAAKGHFLRCLLDGYKYIWYHYTPEVRQKFFWAKILGDLQSIDNGNFVKQISELRSDAKSLNFKAREIESKDKDKSLDLYEQSIGKVIQLDELYESHVSEIGWSVRKGLTMKTLAALGWIIALGFAIHRNWSSILSVLGI
jgi:hypothetical protein